MPVAKVDQAAGTLVLDGTPLPVTVRLDRTGRQVELRVEFEDALVETERYAQGPNGIRLVQAAGETFAPHVELLRAPVVSGGRWEWEGTVQSGSTALPAEAVLRSYSDRVFLSGGSSLEAIRVDVDLEIGGKEREPVRRQLRFWFVPGQGLVKREFGPGSVRLPAPQ